MAVRIRVEEVLELLEIHDASVLEELRREGLFEQDVLEPEEADELRVAAAWMRELGVNPAGVAVALQLRRRLLELEQLTERSLRRLLSELEPR